MFGKLLGKVTNDPATIKKANDAAERATGQDLDGDGLIAGQPKPVPAAAPAGAAPVVNKPAAPGRPLLETLMAHGKTLGQGGALQGLLGSFKTLPADVQNKAEVQSRALDDGANIPLSSLKGRKKSLLVGINYVGTANALRGCHNDVKNVRKLITETYKFPTDSASQRVLMDDGENQAPTRANILAAFKWLIEGAKDGDSLFFHYSGHGASQKDVRPDTDEADGMDETLVPADYDKSGMIVDDDIFDMLVAPLPRGVRLTAVMDCCHSGSVFDLPYTYLLDGSREVPLEVDNRKVMIAAALAAGKALMAKDGAGVMKNLMEAGKAYMAMQAQAKPPQGGAAAASSSSDAGEPVFNTPAASAPAPAPKPQQPAPAASNGAASSSANLSSTQNVSSAYINIRTTVADVIQFSGCRDEQTSADAFIGGEATGAMSFALIKTIAEGGSHQSYSQLLRGIRSVLLGKYKQVPQMSTGHRMVNLDGPFEM